MRLSSLTPDQLSAAQIALAAVLAVVGFLMLLPRPRGRFVPGGVAFLIAAVVGFGVWLYSTFGKPMPDAVGSVLFILFSLGALGFGTVLVVQRNPARGAIAFAFVILSTCGLFLLLAAPFLMAATIIIYAGAIIVTFLFVLMLSQVQGPSDENDRSREPLFGGLAGFAFTGLVLFAVYLSSDSAASAKVADAPKARQILPAPVVVGDERARLLTSAGELNGVADQLKTLNERLGQINEQISRLPATDEAGRNALRDSQHALLDEWRDSYSRIAREIEKASKAVRLRLTIEIDGRNENLRDDEQANSVRQRAKAVLDGSSAISGQVEGDFINTRHVSVERVEDVRRLREEVLLLAGSGELPARNVANLGYVLYAHHLLAVELAGTLLLVATVGAVAITRRRGSTA
jgi:NADH:ubiquinone oxidoreductase subunit 6 (subunit J)